MAPKQPVTKYQYVVTPEGPKLMPVDEPHCKDEESPADYNVGGYLPVKVGDAFNKRYRVVRKLGWGHFSTVWLVKDSKTHRHSALKIVKSAPRYAETARDEIKLLSRVSSSAPMHPGHEHIVSFLDSFSHQGPEASHICIVFEPLGENLLALIERNKKKGVPLPLVKVIAKQILLGLEYLHDECDLIHTDIKPENILISIADIEAHIHSELSVSPSPTCRRVGVPPPTKTRSGVTIPSHHQQRARKQVQIFESQPLASPGRSAARSAGAVLGMSVPTEANVGGNSSLNGSYVAQMNITRTGNHLSGTVGSFSSAGRVTSGLSASAPRTEPALVKKGPIISAAKGATVAPTQAMESPSTSSSSSSISSALASTTADSSSLVSTPPTSLSHSLGNAIMEFMGTGTLENELRTKAKLSSKVLTTSEYASPAPTVILKKPKATIDLETQLSSAISSSWKATTDAISQSWKEKISNSFTSNKSKSSPSKTSQQRHVHTRSHSGLANPGFWKDPGAAAPAPAILVSAVVSAGGQQDDFSKLTAIESTHFPSSTIGRPPPISTPLLIAKKSSLIHNVSGLNKATSSHMIGESSPSNATAVDDTRAIDSTNQHLSLLTQTAPSRPDSMNPLSKRTTRASPPQQVSQLSAHMHTHKLPSLSHSSSGVKTKSPLSRDSNNPSISSAVAPSSASITPTPASPTPAVPPSTPNDPASVTGPVSSSPAVAALSKAQRSTNIAQPMPIQNRTLPSLTTPEERVVPPAITIKIADLGNATPSKQHYTEEIQTRQYRSPEAIIGRRDWDDRADIWSVACVIFELLTAEYLFEPQSQGDIFSKDDDHMAQIIELLGDFPLELKMGGRYSQDLFSQTGTLRWIRTLKPWPLKRVMIEKYLFSEQAGNELCDFLDPMLMINPRERAHARDLKDHKWLEVTKADGVVTDW